MGKRSAHSGKYSRREENRAKIDFFVLLSGILYTRDSPMDLPYDQLPQTRKYAATLCRAVHGSSTEPKWLYSLYFFTSCCSQELVLVV